MILRHGNVVEIGATELVFGNPVHPYTKTLLASVPQLHTKWKDLSLVTGNGPGPAADLDTRVELVEIEANHFAALEGKEE